MSLRGSITGVMGAKALKGRLDMKSRLGLRIGEEKRESEEIPLPPMDDITWQSPNIFPCRGEWDRLL